jgi:HEAT repeat protein
LQIERQLAIFQSAIRESIMSKFILSFCCVLFLSTGAHGQGAAKFLDKRADEWVRQLKADVEPRQRRNAAFALGKMGNRAGELLETIKGCLAGEKDAKVREAIVFALGEIGRDSLRGDDSALIELLSQLVQARTEDALVRRSAAYALGCLNAQSPQAFAALEAALDDPEAMVRQNAAWALGQYREAALPALQKKALHDADALVQRDAAAALLQMRDGEKVRGLIPDLLPLCENKNSEVRRAAANVLVRVVEKEDKLAAQALRGLLEDSDLEIKRNAALALSNIGGKEAAAAVPVLLAALRDDDVEVRRLATAGLGNLGPDAAAAVPDLLKLLRGDKDTEVRSFAAQSLGGIGQASAEVISALVERIRDKADPSRVRAGCATALNFLGAKEPDKTRGAIPQLLVVLQDPGEDIEVRGRIIWALRPNHVSLPDVSGVFETFGAVLKEPRTAVNAMLRYDCAFMLGMIWKQKAPDSALDVLSEFLRDPSIKIFDRSTTSVGGTGAETSAGRVDSKDLGRGDARIMVTQALEEIGKPRWAGRKDIVDQLRVLAADATLYPKLRRQAQELVKMLP